MNNRDIQARLKDQHIETPSWGYGDSGTRFGTFHAPGAARNVFEKIDDAAYVHSLCGIAPSVALHIPWDKTDDWAALSTYAKERGISIGAINPNLFQDQEYKLGSLCHPDKAVRKKSGQHLAECCEIMQATGSQILSVWLADGTNYAGQDDIRSRKERLLEGLASAYESLPQNARMLVEYKFFEPAFYHTDIADWGTAFALCLRLGPKAQVLVDTGHHAQGTNIAYIVAQLLDEGRLGGFHFNARQYADDDLIVGSTNPWELFVIFHELISAEDRASSVAYMIDQSHNIEPKLEAMLLSVLNCQTAFAKALMVDRRALASAQQAGDILRAHRIMVEAFETDVRPALREFREKNGLPEDPISALRSDNYLAKCIEQRD